MSRYQDFLDFFKQTNKERLDGLNESHFSGMTEEERDMAFEFLLKRVASGGTEESVNGLFRANEVRAAEAVRPLLMTGQLRGEAEIAAAWNLNRIERDDSLQGVFIKWMASPDDRLRTNAAYYVPAQPLTPELKAALQGMIRTETVPLARIHAVDKFLAAYGIEEDSDKTGLYLKLYRGLRSDDLSQQEAAFRALDSLG